MYPGIRESLHWDVQGPFHPRIPLISPGPHLSPRNFNTPPRLEVSTLPEKLFEAARRPQQNSSVTNQGDFSLPVPSHVPLLLCCDLSCATFLYLPAFFPVTLATLLSPNATQLRFRLQLESFLHVSSCRTCKLQSGLRCQDSFSLAL